MTNNRIQKTLVLLNNLLVDIEKKSVTKKTVEDKSERLSDDTIAAGVVITESDTGKTFLRTDETDPTKDIPLTGMITVFLEAVAQNETNVFQDSDLQAEIAAGLYDVRIFTPYFGESLNVTGFKFRLGGTASKTVDNLRWRATSENQSARTGGKPDGNITLASAQTYDHLEIYGTVQIDEAGTLVFAFAQNVNTPDGFVYLRAGSSMILTPLS